MKLITPIGTDEETFIDTEIRTTDGFDIYIFENEGFAGVDGIQIQDYILSWKQVDELKRAIAKAEELWR